MDQVDDPEAEYAVVVDLFFPFALSRFEAGFRDWDAADVKAIGVAAVAVAVLGSLIAAHDSLNALWWLPAVGCVVAAVVAAASVVPRSMNFGPDLPRFIELVRQSDATRAGVARALVAALLVSTAENGRVRDSKANVIRAAMTIFLLAALGCIGVLAARP